ncbi:MAG: cytochrome c [Acidobacteriota bacterium]|nr:cytochrome c [Acidobacteriota bacterium]
MVATGRQIYEKFGCAQCHGPEGRGDGPAAPFLTGMAGTSMPSSYVAAIESEEEAWALVYYVLWLTPGGTAQPTAGDRVRWLPTPDRDWRTNRTGH